LEGNGGPSFYNSQDTQQDGPEWPTGLLLWEDVPMPLPSNHLLSYLFGIYEDGIVEHNVVNKYFGPNCTNVPASDLTYPATCTLSNDDAS